MTTDDELKIILKELENCAAESQDIDLKEQYINGQITSLRLQLAQLKDARFSVKQRVRKAEFEKQSIERKLELEREAAEIQRLTENKKAEAEKILADAPWKDDAYDWQIDGAIKLPKRALLGDKRGMGKTFSAIIWRRLQKAKKTLVCLRKEVASDFIKELGIREPNLFVYSLLGANSQERNIAAMLLNNFEDFVVVTNIESWRRDVDGTTEDILKIDYDTAILDEAHHIKNIRTGTAQGFLKLAEKIPNVLEMTGTPIKNKPQEMFTLLHALYPDLFPKETYFLRDYCTQISQNKWTFTDRGLVNLVNKISPFYLARSPEDVGRKIPPPRMIEYKLTLDNHLEQKQAYKLMTERSMAMLSTGKVIPIVSQLAIMTRQAQTVSWPAGITFNVKDEEGEIIETLKFDVHQSVKADWAEDFIKELVDEGERVVLFSRFKPVIYELKRRFELIEGGPRVAVITGDEKGDNKPIFDDFDLKTASKDEYKYDVLLATYQTVGESANLNAARHMILYDRFWNPGNDDQAIGRIDRINSIDQATVHLPLVENTIDEYMLKLIDEKRSIVSGFKDAASMRADLMEHLSRTV